jgi:hypothetical protein
LAGHEVVLHQVNDSGGVAIDSVLTNDDGRYRFYLAVPDTSAEYVVSVEFDGIGYFSAAMRLFPGGVDSVPPIVVFDTAYGRPEILLQERHIIVRSEEPDGTRQVIELIALRNDGRFTRIAADTASPVWQMRLPAGMVQLAIGESEVGSGAVYERGDALAIAAPLPPGEKQVLFSYFVPRGRGLLQLPVDQPIGRMTLSVEDTNAVVTGTGVVLAGTEEVGGVGLKRYDARNLAAWTPVSVRFVEPFFSVGRLQLLVVIGAGLMLAGTLTWWVRRQPSRGAVWR